MIAASQGAFAFIAPGAFNLTTGELHWELQARARAVDNHICVAFCSLARDTHALYHAWGHSMQVNPMAKVVCEAQEKEEIVYGELTDEEIMLTRKRIPVSEGRRFDVYPDVTSKDVAFEEVDGDEAGKELGGK